MWILDHIRSMVAGIAVPAVLILIGAFATLFLTQGPEPSSDRQRRPVDAGRVHIRDRGDEIKMCVDVAPGETLTKLVLTNSSGAELAKLIAYRDGALVLESANSGSSQFVFHCGPNGSVGLALMNNPMARLELLAPADGSSQFVVRSRDEQPLRVVRVGQNGELSSWHAPNTTILERSP